MLTVINLIEFRVNKNINLTLNTEKCYNKEKRTVKLYQIMRSKEKIS